MESFPGRKIAKQGSRNRGAGGATGPSNFCEGGAWPPQYLSRIAVAIYNPKIHQKLQTKDMILMT